MERIILKTMEMEKQLEQLGLSRKEAKLYLNALELGTFSVMGIANKSKLKRPTCYLILDELVKKGLISLIPRAKKLLYMAEPPELLKKRAENLLLLSGKIVPKLNAIRKIAKEGPTVKFYSGQNGIRNIYEDILKSNIEEYFYIGSSKDLMEMAGKEYLDEWLERRIKKGIKAVSIRMKKSELDEKKYQETKKSLRKIRYASDDTYMPDTIIIYAQKVAVISTKAGNFGFVVESEEFVETMMGLFKALWKLSSK